MSENRNRRLSVMPGDVSADRDWPTSAEYHESMEGYERSPVDGFDYVTPPLTEEVEAPLGALGGDPRSVTACRHGWDGTWGEVGERQHHCTTCQRWIWEHSIESKPDATIALGANGGHIALVDCPICGAWVAGTVRHDEWHARAASTPEPT